MIHYNVKKRIYPDGLVRQTVCNHAIFHIRSEEEKRREQEKRNALLESILQEKKSYDTKAPTRSDNLKRAKEKIYDIAYLNDFQYFVTWTLNKECVDRYNPDEIKPKIMKFLNNMKSRYQLKYLIVPEYHKDGAIHFHGLVSGDIKLVDSGKTDSKGHVIYNMPQWKLGYSTAIKLYGELGAVAGYITKYIEKDLQKIFGKFYFASRGLVREPDIEYDILDFTKVQAKEHKQYWIYKYNSYNIEGELLDACQ